MEKKILLGPFDNVYREGELLRFTVPRMFRERVAENVLKTGLKISPRKILRAYKNAYGYFWILVGFERGYDLLKHFKFSDRDKYARRIPRIVVEVCPECGEDLIERVCVNCGDVEKPKYLEVWRDPEAREELLQIIKISKSCDSIILDTSSGRISIPRSMLHEFVASIVRKASDLYVKVLKITNFHFHNSLILI